MSSSCFAGGLLIGRTLAVLVTLTLATSMAAREGPVPLVGYQICLQVWLAVSLLTDALALAGQALLAGGYFQEDYGQSRQVVYKFVAGSHPINALAFVRDGLYYGVSDFGYVAYSMVLLFASVKGT
ncbi:MATE efflux family protein [Actinidia rufa]|uniref:MATE efflux family protein n=1 Tax=Actinidia rufa TaxID=165716 RepID=A0A7J0FBG2_9ERIC|nr:MATE efflux family protein [Actinidia rufa]